jgi:hypothetical protein
VDEGVEARTGRDRLVPARARGQINSNQKTAHERGAAAQQSTARRSGAAKKGRIRIARHA